MKNNKQFAIIEFGSSAIRLAIAVNKGRNDFEIIENLQQTVFLGKDSFTTDNISEKSTTDCIKAIKSFFQTLDEYRISKANIKVVATSAIREAYNRDQFIDRIYISTGLLINVLDEADVCRYAYLAVRPKLNKETFFGKENSMIIEVGGGSTDCVYFEKGRVASSHVYKIGSLRINSKSKPAVYGSKEYLETIANLVQPTINKIRLATDVSRKTNLVALGSEMRFISNIIKPKSSKASIVKIETKDFSESIKNISKHTIDQIAKKYSLSYEGAESLLPTLYIYQEIAKTFKLNFFYIQDGSLRSGIMQEVISTKSWTNEFKKQVYNSAIVLSKKYNVNPRYVSTVCKYSHDMLTFLAKYYEFYEEDEIILNEAAILHEIGHFISPSSHHKHTMYAIENSDLFGISSKNKTLISMVARYHRGSIPKNTHPNYMMLDRTDKIRVTKLAAILRITRTMSMFTQTYQKHKYEIKDGTLEISFDKTLNTKNMKSKLKSSANLFSNIYGLKVVIK
jgi:exopolyphosphatase/guanosine-5'-triphosphate,3'-diphosphate pyrophosphatase